MLEDDAAVASLLRRVLEDEKYYVSTTNHVSYAREFLQLVNVDLFIADVLLQFFLPEFSRCLHSNTSSEFIDRLMLPICQPQDFNN